MKCILNFPFPQASSCWDRDRERNMYKEKTTCWPPHSGLVKSNSSHVDGGVALDQGSPLQRTLSTTGAPCPEDTAPKNPPKTKASFSSITITARRVPQTAGVPSQECPEPGCSTQARGPVSQAGGLMTQARNPVGQAGDLLTQTKGSVAQAGDLLTKASEAHPAPAMSSTQTATPLRIAASSDCEPVVLRKKPVVIKVTEYQETYRPGERAAASKPAEFRHSYSGGDHNMDALCGFPGQLQDTGARSVQSCAHLDRPASSTNSFLFLDKSLSVSLPKPESRREVHRSTLCLYLSGAAPEAGSDGPRRPLSCSGGFANPKPAPAELVTPGLKRWNLMLPGKSDPSDVSDGPSGSNARTCVLKAPLGDARQLRPETTGHGGKPAEEACPRPGDFETRLPVCSQPRGKRSYGTLLTPTDAVKCSFQKPLISIPEGTEWPCKRVRQREREQERASERTRGIGSLQIYHAFLAYHKPSFFMLYCALMFFSCIGNGIML